MIRAAVVWDGPVGCDGPELHLDGAGREFRLRCDLRRHRSDGGVEGFHAAHDAVDEAPLAELLGAAVLAEEEQLHRALRPLRPAQHVMSCQP